MPFYGSIVVIKRSGADGSSFPLINEECLLGRAEGCDIRIQHPFVSKEHAKLQAQVSNRRVKLIALSKTNKTKLNGVAITNGLPILLSQDDQFTIGDRHFRWEYPPFSQMERHSEAEISVKSVKDDEKTKLRSEITEGMIVVEEKLGCSKEKDCNQNLGELNKSNGDQEASKQDSISLREMLKRFIKQKEETIEEKEASLECPVCLETADIPIFRCTKEHLICSKCRHRLSDCPVCRTTYQGDPERYRFAEKIVKELRKLKEDLVVMKMAG